LKPEKEKDKELKSPWTGRMNLIALLLATVKVAE
jgi:hypothetical protein